MNDAIDIIQKGAVEIWMLNNPPAHTFTKRSLNYISSQIERLNADTDNRALIITGQGNKFFSAGADLNQFDHDDVDTCKQFAQAFGDAFQTLTHYRGVSFAAINGYAMGGGLEIALACDIRIAEKHALMALPECAVGLLPCGLGTQHLPKLIGEQWAKRMILLGEKLDASKAESIGLVSDVTATASSVEHALNLAEKLAQQSPLAVNQCKQLIMGHREQPMSHMFAQEQSLFLELWSTDESKEGIQAFLEKRPAKWP